MHVRILHGYTVEYVLSAQPPAASTSTDSNLLQVHDTQSEDTRPSLAKHVWMHIKIANIKHAENRKRQLRN